MSASALPVNCAGYALAQQVPVAGGTQITDTAEDRVYQCDGLGNLILLVSGQDVVDGALDTGVGEHTHDVYALLHAAFGTPAVARLSD